MREKHSIIHQSCAMVAADVTDLECCYKGTFICVQEKTPTMKRTQSLPDMLDVLPASRPDKYVAHLEQRANALSFLPLETDATTPEEKPSVPQGEQTPKGLEEPPSGVVAESEPTGACAGGMPPACASLGSLGHPEFCRKPCLFLYYGECPKGDQCEYCHYTHGQHAKLDKRQREALHSLSEADLLGLLLPHLRARTEKMQPNAAEEVLGLMEKHLAFLPKQKSGWLPPWKFTQLNRLLCQMSFLRLFRLCPCSDVPEIKQAMEALQERCSYPMDTN